MFRNMRRAERALDSQCAEDILSVQNWGVLSVNGDEGYPYGVPVNYAYVGGKIYIHGTAHTSHKSDSIRRNNKVCFTVVSQHELEDENFAVNYTSVIVFGTARIIEEEEEVLSGMLKMINGLAPSMVEKVERHCGHMKDSMLMIEIIPEQITGKSGR